jgi:hypothetical protein
MALEMKTAGIKCVAGLDHIGAAHIRSYECTFCMPCTEAMGRVGPNCGGGLVARPRRRPKV